MNQAWSTPEDKTFLNRTAIQVLRLTSELQQNATELMVAIAPLN
jgi:hypothetical protein